MYDFLASLIRQLCEARAAYLVQTYSEPDSSNRKYGVKLGHPLDGLGAPPKPILPTWVLASAALNCAGQWRSI